MCKNVTQPIVAKVRTAIAAVGKAGNYTFIFEDGAAVYTGTNEVDVTKEVQAKMKKIEDCIHCGACSAHCPYGLDTPKLLEDNYKDYKEVLAGKPL